MAESQFAQPKSCGIGAYSPHFLFGRERGGPFLPSIFSIPG